MTLPRAGALPVMVKHGVVGNALVPEKWLENNDKWMGIKVLQRCEQQ